MATRQYPRIRTVGGSFERGHQYGEQARSRITRSIEAYAGVFQRDAGWDWPTVRAFAQRFERPLRDYDERYFDEIRGIASGAGTEVTDILALNTRTEIMYAAKAADAKTSSASYPSECSSFAVLHQASRDGHVLMGQNWDWLVHSFDTTVVLEAQQDDGPGFVTIVEAGLLAKTGFNSAGLGLVTNALATSEDRGEVGVPHHAVLRGILDGETISDALAAVQRLPRAASGNYLIGHVDGLAVDVEGAPGDFSRLFLILPDNGMLVHTNHFLSPTFDLKDVSLWLMPDSPFRLERVRAFLGELEKIGVEDLMTVLGDHTNYPLAVCCHPDTRLPAEDHEATAASIVMDLDTKSLWLADGNPCTTPFRLLSYSEDFALAPEREPDASPA